MSTRHPNPQDILDFQEKLKILHDLNAELSRSDSLDDLCKWAVELGRHGLGFDRLGLWFFADGSDYIIGTYGTDEEGQTRDERGNRVKAVLDETVFAAFNSHDTRAFRRNVPLYNGYGQEVGQGESAMGILWDGTQKLGWLSADNFIRQTFIGDNQIELLGLYSTAVGHLVTRKRAEEELREREEAAHEFQMKLKALHEVTIELSKTRSFDDLCRRAVELGRSRLGFDRLGLWFFDTDQNYMIGSFGIDENGRIRDERGQRIPRDFGEMVELLDGRVLASAAMNTALFDDQQKIVGYGWKAAGKVLDGDRSIGWLSTDNFFSHQSRSNFALELLALYATTLGHLAALRKFEDALAAERTLFRVVIDTVPDMIFVKDTTGRFMMVNRACWAGFPGIASEQDLIGKTDYDVHSRELADQYTADDQKIIRSGQAITNVHEPGFSAFDIPKHLLTTKVPLKDKRGNITGLVGVSRDVTALQRVEQQTRELAIALERVSVLKEFMTSISHDFRTPLSVINSSLYVLERMTEPEQRQVRLDAIKRQVVLLNRFVEEIMTSARVEQQLEIHFEPINLNAVLATVEETLRPAADDKGLVLAVELQNELPSVDGNNTDLNRAFSNLIQNAIHYTLGGTITIRSYLQGSQVGVDVIDTGIGISESDLPRIFDHFYRVDKTRTMDKSGMGLGLAITKRIVEIHNGTIDVESTPGKGTLFRVLLPSYHQDLTEQFVR